MPLPSFSLFNFTPSLFPRLPSLPRRLRACVTSDNNNNNENWVDHLPYSVKQYDIVRGRDEP